MKKSKEEIKKTVKEAIALVGSIYKDDERLKNPESARPDSGVSREMDIVLREVIAYMLRD